MYFRSRHLLKETRTHLIKEIYSFSSKFLWLCDDQEPKMGRQWLYVKETMVLHMRGIWRNKSGIRYGSIHVKLEFYLMAFLPFILCSLDQTLCYQCLLISFYIYIIHACELWQPWHMKVLCSRKSYLLSFIKITCM